MQAACTQGGPAAVQQLLKAKKGVKDDKEFLRSVETMYKQTLERTVKNPDQVAKQFVNYFNQDDAFWDDEHAIEYCELHFKAVQMCDHLELAGQHAMLDKYRTNLKAAQRAGDSDAGAHLTMAAVCCDVVMLNHCMMV